MEKGTDEQKELGLRGQAAEVNENCQEARKMGTCRQTKGFSTRSKEQEMKNGCQQGVEMKRTDQILT